MSVVCSVRSNVVPSFHFAFSDVVVTIDDVISTGFQHQATLKISLYLTSGTAYVGCTAGTGTLRLSADLFIPSSSLVEIPLQL